VLRAQTQIDEWLGRADGSRKRIRTLRRHAEYGTGCERRPHNLLSHSVPSRPAIEGFLQSALLERLRARYPEVTRWQVERFARPRNEDSDALVAASSEGASAEILSIGSRSAVRVGHHTYWYTVAGYRNVVSAARRAAAGETLDARDGSIEERDVLATGCEALTDTHALAGMRARRPIGANEIICANAIEPRPTVARGEAVTVKYVAQHIVLTTRAIAQADGAIGDTLRVRSTRGSEEFPALVSGAGEVTIHE
jgi:flagella basal body P-ring formation protein FlgA